MAREFGLRPADVYDLNIDQWEVFKASAEALKKRMRQEERDSGDA